MLPTTEKKIVIPQFEGSYGFDKCLCAIDTVCKEKREVPTIFVCQNPSFGQRGILNKIKNVDIFYELSDAFILLRPRL